MESLIKEAVGTVIQMSQSWLACRNVLVNRLIEVLETDATWVEMYGITGELHVPALIGDIGELSGPLSEVKKVRQPSISSLCFLGDDLVLDLGVTQTYCW